MLLIATFLLVTLIKLFYWLFIFSRLAFYKLPTASKKEKPPVSVIICAKNEAENLKKFLPIILNQKYPEYEVIIVNDFSSDNTLEILLEFQKKNPILHIVNNRGKKHYPGKKAILELGISQANFEFLLLTDADCYPTSHLWIERMQAGVLHPVEIGLGFSPYQRKSGFLNAFIRFETLIAAIQYLSLAINGIPYMGVGRNLIYKKSLFLRQGGFKSHEHITSGDDDLFVNATANRQNTTVIIDPLAFVYSIPKSTWARFYYQKSRHLTTGRKYKLIHKVILGCFSMSHFLHYALGIWLLFVPGWAAFVAGAYFLRIAVLLLIASFILKKLKQEDLLPWFPLLDVAFVLYYLIFSQTMILGNTKKW